MDKSIKAHFDIGENKGIAGYLDLSNHENRLRCWSPNMFAAEDVTDIFGVSDDNKKISLLNSFGSISISYLGDQASYSSDIYSHVIISGGEHVNNTDSCISSISFSIVNPEKIVVSKRQFGIVGSVDAGLINSLNEQKYTPNFSEASKPVLAFFNGDFEIFKQDTALGIVSAENNVRVKGGGVKGIHLENEVVMKITFDSPVLLDEAFKRANFVSLFLRTVAGDGLSFNNIKVNKNNHELEVYKNNFSWGDAESSLQSDEPLLDLSGESFPLILKDWLDKKDRMNARYSFFNTYLKEVFSSERVIVSANMFDILPEKKSAKQSKAKKILDDDVILILDDIKNTIQDSLQDHSNIKDSLLKSVEHLTKKSNNPKTYLRAKIQTRAELIIPYFNLPNLDLVIKHAVKCRNYFVHGTEDKSISPNEYIDLMSFFINTMEFIFITSELIECGWRPEKIRSPNHKVTSYTREYKFNLSKLEELLAAPQ